MFYKWPYGECRVESIEDANKLCDELGNNWTWRRYEKAN